MLDPQEILTTKQLAAEFKLSPDWIREHTKPTAKLKIPSAKVGGRYRYRRGEVHRWLDEILKGKNESC